MIKNELTLDDVEEVDKYDRNQSILFVTIVGISTLIWLGMQIWSLVCWILWRDKFWIIAAVIHDVIFAAFYIWCYLTFAFRCSGMDGLDMEFWVLILSAFVPFWGYIVGWRAAVKCIHDYNLYRKLEELELAALEEDDDDDEDDDDWEDEED